MKYLLFAIVAVAHGLSLPRASFNISMDVNNPVPDVTLWKFSCYAANEACRGNAGNSGSTTGGSASAQSCNPIATAGCTRYKYNGGGAWKICIYDGAFPDNGCMGNLITSVNGGNIGCIDISNPRSYKVIRADTDWLPGNSLELHLTRHIYERQRPSLKLLDPGLTFGTYNHTRFQKMSTLIPISSECHAQIALYLEDGLTDENVSRAIEFMQGFDVHVTEEARIEDESKIIFRIKNSDIKYFPDKGGPLATAIDRQFADAKPLIRGYNIVSHGPATSTDEEKE
nr:hypothetical protein CFP56_16722 [Quercus suber]